LSKRKIFWPSATSAGDVSAVVGASAVATDCVPPGALLGDPHPLTAALAANATNVNVATPAPGVDVCELCCVLAGSQFRPHLPLQGSHVSAPLTSKKDGQGNPITATQMSRRLFKTTQPSPRRKDRLRIEVVLSQSTVAKYMARGRRPPSQTWRTFLANHVDQVMATDFFVVPTATYRLLFVLVILAHDRRRVVHDPVTDHLTAAWTAQQLRNAFPNEDGLPAARSRRRVRRHRRHPRGHSSSAKSDRVFGRHTVHDAAFIAVPK
jgi:hypothetical protein